VFGRQCRVGDKLVADHGYVRHALDAPGNDHIAHAGHDLLGGNGNALHAAGAEAIDGLAADRLGQTRAQHGDARHVHALLRFGEGAAQRHIFNLGGSMPARSITSLITTAAMSSGRVVRRLPRVDLPTAVLAADTMTALRMVFSFHKKGRGAGGEQDTSCRDPSLLFVDLFLALVPLVGDCLHQ
jgi:hypothetical protein